MKLRKDPAAITALGGVITQQNAAVLGKRIGRQPTEGELYVVAFLRPLCGRARDRARRGAISPIVAELWTPRGSAPGSESGAPLDRLYQEPRRGSSNEGSRGTCCVGKICDKLLKYHI